MHAHIETHTHRHTVTHTGAHTYIDMYPYIHAHILRYTRIHTQRHAFIHKHTDIVYIYSEYMDMHSQIYHTHSYTHTHPRVHPHTHIHTHDGLIHSGRRGNLRRLTYINQEVVAGCWLMSIPIQSGTHTTPQLCESQEPALVKG